MCKATILFQRRWKLVTEKQVTVEELLEKARRPSKLALAYHPFYEGKVQVMPKCAIRSAADFAIWYTPGVAASPSWKAKLFCSNTWAA
jgi:malic enzyme